MSIPVSEQLYHFVDDLESSLRFDLGMTFDCDDILLCGVGGSAVSGDISADCCYTSSKKRIHLVKYPELPGWAGPRTLAVVSSYSGNTVETLKMYEQAMARNCQIVTITSGGELGALAKHNGDCVVPLPQDMQPRHAIGFMIGYTLAVIRAAGGPDISEELESIIPKLRKYRDDISGMEDNLAKDLASAYLGKVPIICSDCSMKSVSFRWKTQINENSKFVAFCESLPGTFMHSIENDLSHDNCIITMLIGCDDCMCEGTDLLEKAADMLEMSSKPHRIVRLGGSSTLENMFKAIILGDYVSVYMAQARGIDAAEVKPVMQLKYKLAQRHRSHIR